MSIEKVLYRAHATATGGRDGRAVASDGALDVGCLSQQGSGKLGDCLHGAPFRSSPLFVVDD